MTSEKEEIFGRIIQEERKAKSTSQEKFAKITCLDRTAISLIENGKRSPTSMAPAHAAFERQTPPAITHPVDPASQVHLILTIRPFS